MTQQTVTVDNVTTVTVDWDGGTLVSINTPKETHRHLMRGTFTHRGEKVMEMPYQSVLLLINDKMDIQRLKNGVTLNRFSVTVRDANHTDMLISNEQGWVKQEYRKLQERRAA